MPQEKALLSTLESFSALHITCKRTLATLAVFSPKFRCCSWLSACQALLRANFCTRKAQARWVIHQNLPSQELTANFHGCCAEAESPAHAPRAKSQFFLYTWKIPSDSSNMISQTPLSAARYYSHGFPLLGAQRHVLLEKSCWSQFVQPRASWAQDESHLTYGVRSALQLTKLNQLKLF